MNHITLVGNSENLTWRKTPHTNGDKNTYKILPTVDFDYTRSTETSSRSTSITWRTIA